MKLEQLPENKKMTLVWTMRKIHFYSGLFVTIAGLVYSFIVFPTTYVQAKSFELEKVTIMARDHEARIKNLERLLPLMEKLAGDLQTNNEELKSFRAWMDKYQDYWTQLFRDFDLKRK